MADAAAMTPLHIAIHARPSDVPPAPPIRLGGRTVVPFSPTAIQMAAPFSVTFEQVYERLASEPRLFLEPDGSLVWASAASGRPWQLDGQLHDLSGRLTRVDLRGTCPTAAFDRLLTALGWPSAPLMFQLVAEALFLEERALRDYALDCGAIW